MLAWGRLWVTLWRVMPYPPKILCLLPVLLWLAAYSSSAPERSIRGAVTALSWITGKQIKSEDTVEVGVRRCLELLDEAKLARPRDFEWKPAQPS